MKRYLLLAIPIACLALCLGFGNLPPSPLPHPILLSPKSQEQSLSLGSPMARPSALSPLTSAPPPSPLALPSGFRFTDSFCAGGRLNLAWQQGDPPFQLQCASIFSPNNWTNIGGPILNRYAAISLTGNGGLSGNAFFRVQSSVSPILGIGTFNSPEKIMVMTNGTYVYPYSDGSFARLGVWTSLTDFVAITVPGFSAFRNPTCTVVGDRVIIADSTINGTNRLAEYQLSGTNLTTVTNFGFGTASGTAACTVNGTAFVFSFRPSTTNHVFFTSVMRQANGTYNVSAEFDEDSSTGQTLSTLMTAVGYHGLAWLFNVEDGGQCVSVSQFTTTNTLLFFKPNFISSASDLGPSGELPIPTSTVDTSNDRILLGYASYPEDMTCCVGEGDFDCSIAGRSSIVSLTATNDLNVQNNVTLLGTTPWWGWHSDYPLVSMFPRSSKVDTVTENVVIAGCDRSQIEFQLGTFQGGICTGGAVVVQGANVDVAGFSSDGWIVYRSADLKYRLAKF